MSRTSSIVLSIFAATATIALLTGCNGREQGATTADAPYGEAAPAGGAPQPVTPSQAPVSVAAGPKLEGSSGAAAQTAPPKGPAAVKGGDEPHNHGSEPHDHTEPGSAGPAGPPTGMPPMAGMGGNPSAPLTPTPDLDKKIEDLKKATDKKALAEAYADRGYERMTDDAAGARVKYRAALEDFRESLKLDPTNKKAIENKKMIEDIYTSMGRPIPQ